MMKVPAIVGEQMKVFTRDGILTDRGSNISSQLMKELCELLKIRDLKCQSTIHRPTGWWNDLMAP